MQNEQPNQPTKTKRVGSAYAQYMAELYIAATKPTTGQNAQGVQK